MDWLVLARQAVATVEDSKWGVVGNRVCLWGVAFRDLKVAVIRSYVDDMYE